MKKIRFIAIFLVLLMLAMPVLTACKDDTPNDNVGENPDDGENNNGGEDKPTPTPPNKPPINVEQIPAGYAVYNHFDSMALGTLSNSKTVVSAAKTGVKYSIVEDNNYRDGADVARVLWLYREAMEGVTKDRDGYINLQPSSSLQLADVYAVEFDIKVTEKTTGTVQVNGRKAASGGPQFSNFLTYNSATGKLTANGQAAGSLSLDTWHTVTIMIYDEALYYDVYLDGYKMVGQVDYVNANYPKRSDCEINLYRITMDGTAKESEFYLDNVAIYRPQDSNNRPNVYKGSLAKTYEQINMPDITLFDASTITSENYQALIAKYAAAHMSLLNGYVAEEGAEPVTGQVDLKDAIRIEAVSPDGKEHYPLAENWGDPFSKTDEELAELGYSKYLFLDAYDSGFNAPAFLFDPEFMASCGIPVKTGAEIKESEEIFTGSDVALFYDISNYSTLEIEFYIPPETLNNEKGYYQFLVYLASGNRDPVGDTNNGISYFSTALKTSDSRFSEGTAKLSFNIAAMGSTREAKLTTITSVEFRFSGWSNTLNGANTNKAVKDKDYFLSNDHPVAIKSIKLSGGIKVPVEDPAAGMENCTHKNEEGVSLMTEEIFNPATCTDYGYAALKCTACGKTSPKVITKDDPMNEVLQLPVGHRYGSADENAADYNEREVVYPSCTLGGSSTAKCLDCGVPAVMENYAPLGHSYITKIDNASKQISFDCPVCGAYEFSKFADEMPKAADIKAALEAAGYTVKAICVPTVDLTAANSTDDTESFNPTDSSYYVKPTLGTKFNILLRGGKFEILTEGEGEEATNFIRMYHTSQAHSYAEVVPGTTASDVVFELNMRLGPQVDGKYTFTSGFQLIDRSTAALAAGGNYMPTFANLKDDGTFTLAASNYAVQLSEDKFTNIAIAFHFGNNTLDVYIDGVMRAKDLTINNDANANMAAFGVDEIRFFQVQKGTTASWLDIGNTICYNASFPVAFTSVALDGVVADYSGTVLDNTFDDDYSLDADENTVVTGTATVTENALLVSGKTDVKFVTDPLKRNSAYIITIDFKGTENNMKNGVLLTGLKSNFYGQELSEAILTVDADGDIVFYNQIIGNTSETMKIEVAVNEEKNTIDVYVNGAYVASGWYVNADYCNAEDGVYVTGYVLGCTDGAEYSVDSFTVVTGRYEKAE